MKCNIFYHHRTAEESAKAKAKAKAMSVPSLQTGTFEQVTQNYTQYMSKRQFII